MTPGDPSLDHLAALERSARRLEPGPGERAALLGAAVAHAEGFLDSLDERPAFRDGGGRGEGLAGAPIAEEPIDVGTALELVRRHVDGPALNPASPGHLAYIPGGGLFPSALGDFLAAVTNRYAGVAYAGPGAVRMENMLVRWMADLAGLPASAGGDLTSGGSLGNLSAVVTAREAHGLRARDVERAVVYLTGQAHHCVVKALRLAGLGETVRRVVPMDARWRMRPDALRTAVDEDRASGLRPWLVVATAGTADTGAVDPLDEIGAVADEHDLWYHVDAAYGGFFRLVEETRPLLAGMSRAHSVVMDPHKGLFLPYGSGALLVRDRRRLAEAHRYDAPYLQDAAEADDEYSPAGHSPELTRPFRGLRLWLPLKLFGLGPFRACLEEKLHLARYFRERLRGVEGFEVGPEPDLSVVTYRYQPPRGDADAFNRKLLREVNRDGRIFLSSTSIDGRFTLRAAILVFRTHRDHVDLAIRLLREGAGRLLRD